MTEGLLNMNADEGESNEETPLENQADSESNKGTETDSEANSDELILGKFKTQDALEEAYKNLESKLKEKNPTAPDKYEFDFSEDEQLSSIAEAIDFDNDPMAQAMIDAFKEVNIPQDKANTLVQTYLAATKDLMPDMEQEMADLGPKAQEVIKEVELFTKKLSEDSQEVFKQAAAGLPVRPSAVVKALHEITKSSREAAIPSNADSAKQQSSSELFTKANEIKKQLEKNPYNKDLEATYNQLFTKAMQLEASGA